MRALRVAVEALLILILPWQVGLSAAQTKRAMDAAIAPFDAPEAIERGVTLFAQRQFAAAAELLEKARQARRPGDRLVTSDSEIRLVLGICYYRLGDLTRAEPLLRKVVRSGDDEARASGRVFLARLFAEQGAIDQARGELREVAGSPTLRDAAQTLLRQSRPHRLQFTLLVSPEYDGNVPLTDYSTWSTAPQTSGDGDMLFLGSVSARPLGNGLLIGDTLAYRQQFQLQDYNLLLNSTWLGYSYLGRSNRLRIAATFSYAMLGGSSLYFDIDAKGVYRRQLRDALGLFLSYDAHYRDYRNTDYLPLSGFIETLQVGLDWGVAPQPLHVGFGYQASREQTQTPDVQTPPVDDFRAWVHGPYFDLRGRRGRVELSLRTAFLHRIFDSGRIDYVLANDLGLSVTLTSWLEFFAGSTLIYNHSNNSLFRYFKPTGSLGLAAYIGVL